MRNEYHGATSFGRRRSGACTVLWALLLITTTACSANGPTPTSQVSSSPTATAATPAYSNSRVLDKYRQLLPQIIKDNNIPGLALAVVDDQQVLWAEGFGVTDSIRNRPVTADTLFSIQSMTKNFTAIAVLMAAQKGLVDVNVPISTYLPNFRVNSIFDEHPEQKMTLTNLLGHTAGFTHEAPVGNNEDNSTATFEEHIESISDIWLMCPVGQEYHYSNNGPDLAGYILQVRSGIPFEQYMQEKLLDPLGMTHSTLDPARIQQVEDRAIGHDRKVATIPVAVPMLGAGGIYSSASDMAKYLQFQINLGVVGTTGTGGGKRLVPESLLNTVDAPPSPLTRQQGQGYGVFVGRKHGTYYIGSGGGGFGFLSDLLWYPELKLGIVVLTNSADHKLQGVLDAQILDDLITDPNTIFHARDIQLNSSAPAPWKVETGSQSTPLPTVDVLALVQKIALTPTAQDKLRWEQYLGSYSVWIWGQALITLRVYEHNGRLYADYLGTAYPLTEVRPGVFFMDNGETVDLRGPVPIIAGVRFTRGNAGSPEATPTGTP